MPSRLFLRRKFSAIQHWFLGWSLAAADHQLWWWGCREFSRSSSSFSSFCLFVLGSLKWSRVFRPISAFFAASPHCEASIWQPNARKHWWTMKLVAVQRALCGKAGAQTVGPKEGRKFGRLLTCKLRPHFWVRNLAHFLGPQKAKTQTGAAQYGQQGQIRWYICFRQCKLAAAHVYDTVYTNIILSYIISILAYVCIRIYMYILNHYNINNGHGSLRGDPDLGNEWDTQMISNLFKRVWICMDQGYGSPVRPGMDGNLTFWAAAIYLILSTWDLTFPAHANKFIRSCWE